MAKLSEKHSEYNAFTFRKKHLAMNKHPPLINLIPNIEKRPPPKILQIFSMKLEQQSFFFVLLMKNELTKNVGLKTVKTNNSTHRLSTHPKSLKIK